MKGSIKLFSVKGIEINVHFTFLLILVWAAYRWGVQAGEGLTGALFGVVVTLLLFACVTLHELAHSLTAMKCTPTALPAGPASRPARGRTRWAGG